MKEESNTSAPGDSIAEIARRFGRPLRWVRLLKSRHHAPVLSPNCFTLWLLARKESRRRSLQKYSSEHAKRNRAKRREQQTEWRANNPGRSSSYSKVYYEKNADKVREAGRLYSSNYRSLNKERINRSLRERFASDPEYRLACNLRARIRAAIKREKATKSDHTLKLIGCTWSELRDHLQKQFKKGMTWGNYGSLWQIDHRIAMSWFDLTNPEHQKLCCHYSNLQPLLAPENQSKGKRITQEHQFPLLTELPPPPAKRKASRKSR